MYGVVAKGSDSVVALGNDGEIGIFDNVDPNLTLIRLSNGNTNHYFLADNFDLKIDGFRNGEPTEEDINLGKIRYNEELGFYVDPNWKPIEPRMDDLARKNAANVSYLASMLDIEM